MSYSLEPPSTFPFPFEPYDIQHALMTQIYENVEKGSLSILESPTGTGKTLSLLCGVLTWLRDHETREKTRLEEASKASTISVCDASIAADWISEQSSSIKQKEQATEYRKELLAMARREAKILSFKKRQQTLQAELEVGMKAKLVLKASKAETDTDIGVEEDADWLLPEESNSSSCTDPEDNDLDCTEKDEDFLPVKIFFCSRTHSQLSQVVGEVQRSPFCDSVRVVSLASRQSYCVNPTVRKLQSHTLMNERCTELRKVTRSVGEAVTKRQCKTEKADARCEYVQRPGALELLSLASMLEVLDVEQLVQRGKELKACPYYASRSSLEEAQLVLLPYTTLLHSETRKASGIDLRGCVVIIDEAHNLLDTISHIHSCEVTGFQLSHAHSQLSQYEARYLSRLSALNLMYVRQLLFILGRFIALLGGKAGCDPSTYWCTSLSGDSESVGTKGTTVMTLVAFMCATSLDNVNIFKLLGFCERTKLANKLNGFAEQYEPSVLHPKAHPKEEKEKKGVKSFLQGLQKPVASGPSNADTTTTPSKDKSVGRNPILPFLALLKKLVTDAKDARVVCDKQLTVGRSSMKFLLLNPAAQFSEVVSQARAVIVAGGTMQPSSEFRVQLFESAGAPPERISEFVCGHVVPSKNILPVIVSNGPSELRLDFSFRARNLPNMMNELGRCLVNLSVVVPAGLVVFFPSYDYERQVFEHWSQSGTLASLEKKKKVFREPKVTGGVDQVLAQFSKHIKVSKSNTSGQNGAVLFSVVGGKMSEGINFSDDLGRCVVVVGMPYPNNTSPELQEKMTYLTNNHKPIDGKTAGQQYYENLCMKAVNQCIGRAVRHREDYATMVLLDHRYHQDNVKAALPSWIKASLTTTHKFGQALGSIKKFFNQMESSANT